MKKRGFTLVELLGVIVVLAIIALLAVGGYGKVSENVKKQSYNNVVALIETKASEYASDTGNLLTNVGKLVELGYIDADDEEGHVKSPIDGSPLNCHIVSIIKDNNGLYGQYSEEEDCDLEKQSITNMYLSILKYKTEDTEFKESPSLVDTFEEGEEWTNKNVYLVATLGEKLKGQEKQMKKITWTSNVGSEEREVNNNFESQNKYLVIAEQLINTDYTVRIELENEIVYQASTSVKIDKQRPVIYEVIVERPDDWTNQKKITITASDGNGSGIAGFAFTKDNNDCKAANYKEGKESNENIFETTIDEVGTFYVCAKDKADNYSEDKSTKIIEVKNIDKTPPTCVWNDEKFTTWTKEDRTISLSCSDEEGGSGCTLNNAISKTYRSNTKTDYWYYKISDNAGNETVCEKNVKVYVDKCTKTQAVYGSWSFCSEDCGGGTKSREITYYSTFGSGFACSTFDDSTSCNTKKCSGGSGNSGDSGGGKNSCAPNGTSNCESICGFPGSVPGNCCIGDCP